MTQTFSLYEKVYFSLYEMMYKKNICCHYTRRYIMITNIFLIHENVYRVIRDDV